MASGWCDHQAGRTASPPAAQPCTTHPVTTHSLPHAYRAFLQVSVPTSPSSRMQRGFRRTKYLTRSPGHIYPLKRTETGGWRLEDAVQVVRAGRRVMGQFVLGPCVRAAELLASYQTEISFILKEEFCFAKISVQCDQEQIYLVSTYLQLTILN